jgi:phosphopantetheinyl transferase (holo-ACP synthase)
MSRRPETGDREVVASAREVLPIAEVAAADPAVFTDAEYAYARAKSDPERRLAARLAAKRAAARLLGDGVPLADIEVRPARGGPPSLALSARAEARLRALGAERALVSLTHGREHAAAAVLLLRAPRRRRPWRWVLRGSALAVLLAAALLLHAAYAPVGDYAPHPFNQDRNAVWIAHRWLERDHPEPEIEALLASLQRRGVAYVYPHLIPFDRQGRLPPHSREQMRRFLAVSRRAAPSIRVLPWVGGLRVGYRRQRVGSLDLADLVQRQRIVAECRGLMDEGFDGIHLNVEPVDDGNVDFLSLLRALRTAVGTGILSVSAIRPGPMRVPVAPNFFWTPDYYVRVAHDTDQVVVMSYDTAIPTPALYRRYAAYAASTLTTRLHAADARARVLVGVPTYDETGLMHRADVETLENALVGVVAGLRGQGRGGTFEGVALYAEWTTDEEEWSAYERFWRGR